MHCPVSSHPEFERAAGGQVALLTEVVERQPTAVHVLAVHVTEVAPHLAGPRAPVRTPQTLAEKRGAEARSGRGRGQVRSGDAADSLLDTWEVRSRYTGMDTAGSDAAGG